MPFSAIVCSKKARRASSFLQQKRNRSRSRFETRPYNFHTKNAEERGILLSGLALLKATADGTTREFYNGKTVRIVVGYAPGGGYDFYARVIARHMGKHIPGSPSHIDLPETEAIRLGQRATRLEPHYTRLRRRD